MREKFLMKNKSNKEIKKSYKTLFKESIEKISTKDTLFLEKLPLPILKEKEILLCEEGLTEKEPEKAIMNIAQEKSPGNDGLTKEFCKCFWEDLKSQNTKRNSPYLKNKLLTN